MVSPSPKPLTVFPGLKRCCVEQAVRNITRRILLFFSELKKVRQELRAVTRGFFGGGFFFSTTALDKLGTLGEAQEEETNVMNGLNRVLND